MMKSLTKIHKRKKKSEVDSYTKGKRLFQTCRKRCKARAQNCQQQETKGSPRASAGRAIGALREEQPTKTCQQKSPGGQMRQSEYDAEGFVERVPLARTERGTEIQ